MTTDTTAITFLALLLLASCGGSGGGGNDPGPPGLDLGPPPSLTVYVIAVPYGSFPDDRLGEYDQVGLDGYVRLREDVLVNADLSARLICHEMGHSIGLPHLDNPACVMHVSGFTQNTPLCPEEAAHAASTTFTLTVYVGLTPGLLDAAELAASRWNNVAGRTLLAVQ